MLEQYLRISRFGIGDWMLYQLSDPLLNLAERDESRSPKKAVLHKAFRKAILKNARIGSGRKFDLVVKQAVAEQSIDEVEKEISWLSELFGSGPAEIIFIFREPHGWWRSAKKKFGYDHETMFSNYGQAFRAFDQIGGTPLVYDKTVLENYFAGHPVFSKMEVDPFEPKQIRIVDGLEQLEQTYQDFLNQKNIQVKLSSLGFSLIEE